MPSGDDLTTVTFLVSTAIALGGLAVSQGGWKHPMIIGALVCSSAVCMGAGLCWSWLKIAYPSIVPFVLEPSRSPVSWFVVFMATVASFALLGTRQSRLGTELQQTRDALKTPQANTLARAIRIVLGSDASYFPEETLRDGQRRRSVAIGLKNEGNGWLTQCLVEVLSITPEPIELSSEHQLKAISLPCDLIVGMQRHVIVAGYNKIPPQDPNHSVMYNRGPTIYFPAPGAFGGGAHSTLCPENCYTVRLRASAIECGPHEVEMRIWVEPGRTLQAALV